MYSRVSCRGVSTVPFGLSGPASCLNRPEACSELCACATLRGLVQTESGYLKTMFAGFEALCGKCLETAALPAAAAEPLGGFVTPPKPPAL